MEKYEKSLNFLNVLSHPDKLPCFKSTEIPEYSALVTLRDYQLEGITWMRFLNRFGLHGILADEMGLGKTLQILCLLALELNEVRIKKKISRGEFINGQEGGGVRHS